MSKKDDNVKKMRPNAGYYVLIALLVSGIVLVYFPSTATTGNCEVELSDFPMKLGDWVANDRPLSDDVLRTLGAKDYLLRDYRCGDRTLSLYLTYFDTGHGALTHNPEKCFTASGWTFLDKKKVGVPGTELLVLQSTIVRGDSRRMVLYWYQERKRVIVSKWNHVASVLSRALTGRETHSLVGSISADVDSGDEVEPTDGDMDFARQVMEALAEQIPS